MLNNGVTSANVTYILGSCCGLDCKNDMKAFVVEINYILTGN